MRTSSAAAGATDPTAKLRRHDTSTPSDCPVRLSERGLWLEDLRQQDAASVDSEHGGEE